MTRPTVMIVDDADDNRMLQRMILEEQYDIVEADSGESCLELSSSSPPDLFLLDVNMLGMNGYETCMELRKKEATHNAPIIFVSAKYKPEERLEGYESGADDYLVKPVDGETLLEKVDHHLQAHKSIVDAEEKAKGSMNMALEAMTYSSEIGQLLDFVKDSQNLRTFEELGQRICQAAEGFGLQACAYIPHIKNGFINCTQDSMEAQVLGKLENSQEKIISIGIRTALKSNYIILLIKNMPVDDENRYGRIKDHLAVLLSICDGVFSSLEAQKQLATQRTSVLNRVISVTEEKLQEFGEKIVTHDTNVRNIMVDMITDLESRLFSLGLDEDQEAALMNMAYHANEKLNESREATAALERELGIVLEGLYEILASSD